MRVLAIETATEACSIALFDSAGEGGADLLAHEHRTIGRGHAEHLIPMIADLPDKGRAERILVSLGPGSFTGVRIGIAAARALGVAWQAEVVGYPTLALVAAMARSEHQDAVTVCMNGGHGEWFVQDFDATGNPEGEMASLTPEAALKRDSHHIVAGSKAKELATIGNINYFTPLDILPDARGTPLLPATLLQSTISPIYGRAPDAKPQAPKPSKHLNSKETFPR
ncbi:tRNA (adenosine(37)-N6)-threonylcarbamoyltransferase complex dimerization subunit type 1 TsaB [uncultured Erythrobacter sp.]|uniref:tRNA (adenosine(37)-N6)-threonylcarbamoyltransferase complex dimerization subunit type 1 TsaB n=1 Tax=uncultured Erythrobacter sp. TaxID=263913 RepID=UPI002603C68B|nr:tRNA (adenosine(37)-N6)-threonylcarbamoyltransferase complex dimerization subunit type 1 TsaB [uncultured Erythrobacter sp.]